MFNFYLFGYLTRNNVSKMLISFSFYQGNYQTLGKYWLTLSMVNVAEINPIAVEWQAVAAGLQSNISHI